MALSLKVKKILYRLFILLVNTTPLFALLGGTPFFRFTFKELSYFLPGDLLYCIYNLVFLDNKYFAFIACRKLRCNQKYFYLGSLKYYAGLLISTAAFNFLALERPAVANDSLPDTTPEALIIPTEKGDLRPTDTAFSGAKRFSFRHLRLNFNSFDGFAFLNH